MFLLNVIYYQIPWKEMQHKQEVVSKHNITGRVLINDTQTFYRVEILEDKVDSKKEPVVNSTIEINNVKSTANWYPNKSFGKLFWEDTSQDSVKPVMILSPTGPVERLMKEDAMIEIGQKGDIFNLFFKEPDTGKYTVKTYFYSGTIDVHLAAHVKILQQIFKS